MYNEAKKASNNRYLSKFKTISVRMKHADAEELAAKAAEAGESVAGYIMQSCIDRMAGRHDSMTAGGGGLPDELGRKVTQAAEAAGEDPGAWLARAVDDTAARDELIRRMNRDKPKTK